ncbi:unnamed protein product [Chondrus crispus]|uniref:Uncharacterized protein n=1 Tax=Chondrus crispus TaxID=2769 RepID=R7Q3W4_CHOCR|nr:unnamed protein product [Chondrus crispus]CDF32553.1 unnamed protein product [Chondrus crispus]|eukprot:XP_005712218.1 unnamed protein product [Chondrus crispus]
MQKPSPLELHHPKQDSGRHGQQRPGNHLQRATSSLLQRIRGATGCPLPKKEQHFRALVACEVHGCGHRRPWMCERPRREERRALPSHRKWPRRVELQIKEISRVSRREKPTVQSGRRAVARCPENFQGIVSGPAPQRQRLATRRR